MSEGVKNFLTRLGLVQYHDMFVAKGFDSESDICHLDNEDLNSMYITEEGDRQKLLQAELQKKAEHFNQCKDLEVSEFSPSKEHLLYEWLREKGLEHYYISFIQSELIHLPEIARLNLPDEDLYDELEITLPGHRKRLERAVRQLAKIPRVELPSITYPTDNPEVPGSSGAAHEPVGPQFETPVAIGRWGKPRCLSDTKFDFLLVDATVISTIDHKDRFNLEFMVDSGSDVVTLRQIVLDVMDLELIGPIHSVGVHASRTKNIYRANLKIGNEVLSVEVMGESYDSIGSRVLHHFRHYITGSRHVWLKGDYSDPDMSPKSSQPSSSQDSLTTTSSSSQDKLSQHSLPSNTESAPSLSTEHSQNSGEEPEERDVTPEPGNNPKPEDTDTHLQNDSIKGNIRKLIELAQPDIVISNKTATDKVGFNFVKGGAEVEAGVKNDETDKLICDNDDVIDIRPIINANRKRHASDDSGFEPKHGIADVTKIRRKKRKAIQDNLNSLRTIKMNNKEHVDSHVTELGQGVKYQTVMGQRSVYYRSQIRAPNSSSS